MVRHYVNIKDEKRDEDRDRIVGENLLSLFKALGLSLITSKRKKDLLGVSF